MSTGTDLWLGIDLGTTGVRCVVFDKDLSPVSSAYLEAPPRYLPDGTVEQDAESWFDSTVAVMGKAVEGIDASRVRGLSLSTQGISVVPVGADGRPLRPAISWLDLRGQSELSALTAAFDETRLRRRTGKPLSGAYTLPKLLWLARHEPEVVARTASFLLPMDFLLLRLTGRAVTDHTLAGGTMAYRLDTFGWDTELLGAVGIEASALPEIVASGDVVGTLLPSVAASVGLGEIPVHAGAQDQKCAALAAGIGDGVTTLSLGTSGAIEALCNTPTPRGDAPVFPFLAPGRWVQEAPIETAGAAHRWAAHTLYGGDYAALDAGVMETYPGHERPIFLPELSRVGLSDDRVRWGLEPAGVFWGLGLGSGRGDLARAVLEGVGFQVAGWLDRLDQRPSVLRVFGGGTRSPAWTQLLADTTGVALETLAHPEAAAAGAAILAGAPGLSAIAGRFEPDPANAERYAQRRGAWSRLHADIYR